MRDSVVRFRPWVQLMMKPNVFLAVEGLLLFVVWPGLAIFLEGISKFLLFAAPVLYSVMMYCRVKPERPVAAWAWRGPTIRLLIAIPILIVITFQIAPEWWLAFPRERPGLWALVMLLYPLLSALPQEFLYRRFFFWRYEPLLGAGAARLAINALAFGWLHVMYENVPALILSTIGGVLFASTYARSHNLLLVGLEHAVYGQVLFTIGLGRFFYEGPT